MAGKSWKPSHECPHSKRNRHLLHCWNSGKREGMGCWGKLPGWWATILKQSWNARRKHLLYIKCTIHNHVELWHAHIGLQCRLILSVRVHIFILGCPLGFDNCGRWGWGDICWGSRHEVVNLVYLTLCSKITLALQTTCAYTVCVDTADYLGMQVLFIVDSVKLLLTELIIHVEAYFDLFSYSYKTIPLFGVLESHRRSEQWTSVTQPSRQCWIVCGVHFIFQLGILLEIRTLWLLVGLVKSISVQQRCH